MARTWLHEHFARLRKAREEGLNLHEPWQSFMETVQEREQDPPHTMRAIVTALERFRGQRPRSEIAILDHGCGGGFAMLYLLALGYTRTFGVEVNNQIFEQGNTWDHVLADVLGISETRTFRYGGLGLPFDDDTFDFIFSNQVVEHVTEESWNWYFKEEGRVLRRGGQAFHEIPHRLSPFESHTRTWFLHYLPRPVHRAIYVATGRGEAHIHYLRMPRTIRKKLTSDVGTIADMTLESFLANSTIEGFDGPRSLRDFVYRSCVSPMIGWAVRPAIKRLVMLRLLATKAPAA